MITGDMAVYVCVYTSDLVCPLVDIISLASITEWCTACTKVGLEERKISDHSTQDSHALMPWHFVL